MDEVAAHEKFVLLHLQHMYDNMRSKSVMPKVGFILCFAILEKFLVSKIWN